MPKKYFLLLVLVLKITLVFQWGTAGACIQNPTAIALFSQQDYGSEALEARCRPKLGQVYQLVATCQKFQQAGQFHQLATSLLGSGLLQLVTCRLFLTLQAC